MNKYTNTQIHKYKYKNTKGAVWLWRTITNANTWQIMPSQWIVGVFAHHNQYFSSDISSDISSDMDVFYIVAYVGICTSDLSHQFLINNLQMCHQIEAQNNTNMCTEMEIDLKSWWFYHSMKRGKGLRRYLARFPVNCTARLLWSLQIFGAFWEIRNPEKYWTIRE